MISDMILIAIVTFIIAIVSDTVLIAIVASIIAPSVLAFVTYLIQRSTKKAEWEREDKIAKKAEEQRQLTQKKLDATKEKIDELKVLVKNGNGNGNGNGNHK